MYVEIHRQSDLLSTALGSGGATGNYTGGTHPGRRRVLAAKEAAVPGAAAATSAVFATSATGVMLRRLLRRVILFAVLPIVAMIVGIAMLLVPELILWLWSPLLSMTTTAAVAAAMFLSLHSPSSGSSRAAARLR